VKGWKVAFIAAEALWIAYTFFELALFLISECVDDSCQHYQPYVFGLYLWRGVGVGLLIWLAYRFAMRRDWKPNV
jgi:nitric oxide reductase large subunit